VSKLVNCARCDADAAFLRGARPPYEALRPRIRVVDLFAGCGGLTIGVAEAARRLGMGLDVRLAVDFDSTAVSVYRANLPDAEVRQAKVQDLFDGDPGDELTVSEIEIKDAVGQVDVLLGGPPCQGHSSLNNHTRRSDPRNELYLRMARAAEVLEPTLVLIENVPTVTRDTAKVVETTVNRLHAAGYVVEGAVIDLTRLGAAQRRKRHVVLASRDSNVDVSGILAADGHGCADHPVRSVRWAIRDLSRSSKGLFDTASEPTNDNATRIAWLFANDARDLPNELRPPCHRTEHSYKSMYGRMSWNEPAQTVTTGFGSMGQGRYVHPSRRRTITPHEAARLQFLPDFWDFSLATKRGQLAMLIGNAAPPVLASSLLEPAFRQMGMTGGAFPVRRERRQVTSSTDKHATTVASESTGLGVPVPSSEAARNRMRAVRRSGTGAELAVRGGVDRLGLSYAVDVSIAGTRSRADLLFEDAGVVVMVDGCYWHGCPVHGTQAKANASWWHDKLVKNRERDTITDRYLRQLGWVVLRFWEHDDPEEAASKIALIVTERLAATATVPSSLHPLAITA
jgi:DNA (cytosine-5)-methyltransferase 1